MTDGTSVPRSHRPRIPGPIFVALLMGAWLVQPGCGVLKGDPATRPDSTLQAELGLSDRDEVHRITLAGGEQEVFSPDSVAIPEGAWVEFVTADWRVHAIRFEVDGLPESARLFLEESDQVASPPLVERGARFVVSFAGAPDGRYPFLAEGNGTTGRGVVVVGPNR